MLDAGCGTGLCGPLVAPYARRLTGVDLSAGMLAQAHEKQVYDELLQGELTEYLRGQPEAFDVIVSADTLVYFGALDEVVAAAARRAAAERRADLHARARGRTSRRRTIRLRDARPLRARAAYVERVLGGCGLAVDIGQAELRLESGVPVPGLVVRAEAAAAVDNRRRAPS